MNIFIGKLLYNVTEGDLRTVIKNQQSGRSKGFRFVEMPFKYNFVSL